MMSRLLAYLRNECHREVLIKFIFLALILIIYTVYLSYRYGVSEGIEVALVTWSFFVLCTPIADAGFLLDFPIRLLFGLRMIYSEILVWAIALAINGYALNYSTEAYEKTVLTMLFKQILVSPYPYWAIIILSGIGTFLSIHFGDELLDVLKHKDRRKFLKHNFKYKIISIGGAFVLVFSGYYLLLEKLNVNMP